MGGRAWVWVGGWAWEIGRVMARWGCGGALLRPLLLPVDDKVALTRLLACGMAAMRSPIPPGEHLEHLALALAPNGAHANPVLTRPHAHRSREHGPGVVVGALEFFLSRPAPAPVRCSAGPCQLICIPRAAFGSLMAHHPRALAALEVGAAAVGCTGACGEGGGLGELGRVQGSVRVAAWGWGVRGIRTRGGQHSAVAVAPYLSGSC